jgi:hypothetical protein
VDSSETSIIGLTGTAGKEGEDGSRRSAEISPGHVAATSPEEWAESRKIPLALPDNLAIILQCLRTVRKPCRSNTEEAVDGVRGSSRPRDLRERITHG